MLTRKPVIQPEHRHRRRGGHRHRRPPLAGALGVRQGHRMRTSVQTRRHDRIEIIPAVRRLLHGHVRGRRPGPSNATSCYTHTHTRTGCSHPPSRGRPPSTRSHRNAPHCPAAPYWHPRKSRPSPTRETPTSETPQQAPHQYENQEQQ